ncbi:uncharacterized protein L3040_002252 [Drepanopeziza brunnea f. sp. 'multigermtubi']|uniref:uncharacterized protein n=1 Tax=Drepanopeziza brunnea f. sp. 'multigermtubi' TaxID=698441 RepID=UPI00239DE28F|nr:hypothetical protein L3040_002252 [Drepanopeziza brunnea f. sp. 'multigermtubi']
MGVWPFWRSSRSQYRGKSAAVAGCGPGAKAKAKPVAEAKKKSPPPAELHDAGLRPRLRDPATHNHPNNHNRADIIAVTGPERRRSRRDTLRKLSRDSGTPKDTHRTYSFSPGRHDSIRLSHLTERAPVPPVPPLPADYVRGHAPGSDTVAPEPLPAGERAPRAPPQALESTAPDRQGTPTLHKRGAQELARRKSTKRRKEEHDREAEIRAMVAYRPTRPAADVSSSGRPMKRESKKMRGGLNRHMDNPTTNVSVPLADSLRYSVSANSGHQPAYRLSSLDVLAPRPTIKYAERPRYAPGASGSGPDRSDPRRRKVSDRVAVGEKELKANKRVDDLANDLSAGELRELMERDQKRRDKKKMADRVKMERRLAQRQEKQTADEAAAAREGTPTPPNLERGVLGREIVGLGIGTSAVVTSSKRKGSVASDDGRGERPADAFLPESGEDREPPAFHRSASVRTENFTSTSESLAPVIPTATTGTVGNAAVAPNSPPRVRSHTRSASSISRMMELARSVPSAAAPIPVPKPTRQKPPRQASMSSARAPQSWTSFFRRGAKKQVIDSAPSSFSNTSRDSMQSGRNSSHGAQIGYAPMRSTSNIPKRTMSKFREDLPELPLSPPDSRVQSPADDLVPPMTTRHGPDDPPARYLDTPTSGYRSVDATRNRGETPTSGHPSIDSEGSWLSGRRGSKRGSALQPRRESLNSMTLKDKEFAEAAEEPEIAEDEFLSRLMQGPADQHRIKRLSAATENPMPSSDDEEGGSIASPIPAQSTWGAVGRRPTIINRERHKSREGVLAQFEYDSGDEVPDTPNTPTGNAVAQRAPSFDVGQKHARHTSAGSTRLLDPKHRDSMEAKRDSLVEEN